MAIEDRMLDLAEDLDEMGHHDLSDALEAIVRSAEKNPAPQPQIQQLPEETTTMRGPAGWALLQDDVVEEVEMDGHEKQVRDVEDEKEDDNKGVNVGEDVAFETHDAPDEG